MHKNKLKTYKLCFIKLKIIQKVKKGEINMPKNITFSSSEPVTIGNLNCLLQDGQILQDIGDSTTDTMSQKAITEAIINGATSIAVIPRQEFGNSTTLQEVLDYLANLIKSDDTAEIVNVEEELENLEEVNIVD